MRNEQRFIDLMGLKFEQNIETYVAVSKLYCCNHTSS
jgi:hypothetical protein